MGSQSIRYNELIHIPGASLNSACYKLSKHLFDSRGFFSKIYPPLLKGGGVREVFYNFSKAGVARGLHYQAYPKAAERVVTVITGKVVDFVVRFDPTSHFLIDYEHSELGPHSVFNTAIVPGDSNHCHGFIALEDSICLYLSSQEYSPEHDLGFDLLSLPFDFSSYFPLLPDSLIRSNRDLLFPKLKI